MDTVNTMHKSTMSNSPKLAATVSQEVREYFEELAIAEDRTISYLVSRVLTEYVATQKALKSGDKSTDK